MYRIGILFMTCWIFIACGDDNNPVASNSGAGQKAFVLNSIAKTISVINLDSLTVQNDAIALGANSSAVGFSVRGERALVPNGSENNVLILDITNLTLTGTVDLPVGSGATGSAFLDDNIAFVCNLNLGSVSRLDLSNATVTATTTVGRAPSDVAIAAGKVFVANANVDFTTFQPIGNGTVSVIDPQTNQVTNTIDAGATNSQFLAVDPDGDLIVISSGGFGAGNGAVTVIDPNSENVTAGPFVIGDFPGEVNISPAGIAYIASFSNGLYAFNTMTNTVLRNGQNALAVTTPGGAVFGAAGVAFDADGNIYSVNFGDAVTPGTVYVFDSAEMLTDSVKVGVGPFAIAIP